MLLGRHASEECLKTPSAVSIRDIPHDYLFTHCFGKRFIVTIRFGDPEGRASMKRVLFAMLSLFSTPAFAAPPADTDLYVARAMKVFGVPGLSLAVVENSRITLAKGYGVKEIGTNKMVDAHTAFPIGSESKAFTTAALAILVDHGKLKWSDLVKDHLPGFQMYDPYMTDHMTVRDLLTHRSGLGLGEGDLMIFPNTNRNRSEIVHALRYLKPATGFRERYAYDNILYIVAGAL